MKLENFADLRHTSSNNLQPYSISEETRSELRGATPNFRPQRVSTSSTISGKPVLLHSHAGLITYNFHPPFRIDNFLLPLNSILFVNVIAFGLLAPRPYLIVQLLGHQRKLPYWYTLVWNSHQLIPNKAYSPQGRLLRKR